MVSGPDDWFDDLPAALRLARVVAATDPDGPPALTLIYPESGFDPPPRRLGFLAGSFNPPHAAHLAMARAALDAGLDRVVFTLSRRTVDKTTVTGIGLADRLLLLQRLASEMSTDSGGSASTVGVALVNRGLYVDQAEVFRQAWPSLDELGVVLGFDKIVQVFDPRYYADRDSALERLFALAAVYVAPRAGAGPSDLLALLERPENRRFADRVRVLSMPTELAHVSSSEVREARGLVEGLPTAAEEFISQTRAFAPPERRPDGEVVDAYAVRLALQAALLLQPSGVPEPDSRLLRLALAEGPSGRALRAWLAEPKGSIADALRGLPADRGGPS